MKGYVQVRANSVCLGPSPYTRAFSSILGTAGTWSSLRVCLPVGVLHEDGLDVVIVDLLSILPVLECAFHRRHSPNPPLPTTRYNELVPCANKKLFAHMSVCLQILGSVVKLCRDKAISRALQCESSLETLTEMCLMVTRVCFSCSYVRLTVMQCALNTICWFPNS